MIVVGKEISLRSQIPHILYTESGCLTDRCIIQAIEQLRRDRILVAMGLPYDIPYLETMWLLRAIALGFSG